MSAYKSIGGSILVPSVKELAKESPARVPTRYVRPDLDISSVTDVISSSQQVPIIDLQLLLLSGDVADLELQKFHQACKDWGFFQLINHGVSGPVVAKMKMEVQELFNLPMEEKIKLWQAPEDIQGFGQAFVRSEEQKLDWADIFTLLTLPAHLRMPQLYANLPHSGDPSQCVTCRDALEAYSSEMENLSQKILSLAVKALGMNPDDMKALFKEGCQSIRSNYYPPCPTPKHVIGISPHSDVCGLTILLQVNDMEGRQIRKDGNWVPVKPLADVFVVNIGDSLEILSNGIYRSSEHRATVNSTKERLSVATFYSPGFDRVLEPAPSLISPETPAVFSKITFGEFLNKYLSAELVGKSRLDLLKI